MSFDAFASSSSIIPHPSITEPKLHLAGISQQVTDSELADSFRECLRARFHIQRDGSAYAPATGLVEFEHLRNAEKAYATLQGLHFGPNTPSGGLSLTSIPPEDGPDPKPAPSAISRIIKQLPPDFTSGEIFELFRIFGPIYRINLPNPGRSRFAVIEYYDEEHAEAATSEMNFTEIQGLSILVEKFDPKKPAAWANAGAPAFIPRSPTVQTAGTGFANGNATAGLSPTATPWSPPQTAQTGHRAVSGQSIHAPGGVPLPRSGSQHYDPCNLFIKNLDPTITSQDLFLNFKGFGKIVSARVMRNDAGDSKEFGFVSFEREEEAARALQAMDGLRVRNRTIVVRFHEPKKYREARVRPIPGGSDTDLANGLAQTRIDDSGSSSPLMSSSAELSRAPSVSEVSPAFSETRTMPPFTGNASVFAPDTAAYGLPTATAAGPSSSASPTSGTGTPAGLSERDRLLASTRRLLPDLSESQTSDIADMLAGLPKKDRAMCLFNQDVLRQKVQDAREILESQEDEEEPQQPKSALSAEKATPTPGSAYTTATTTPIAPATAPPAAVSLAPQEAEKSAATPTTAMNGTSSPLPQSPSDLAKLPAKEIIASLRSPSKSESIPAPDASAVSEMDEFINSLESKPAHEQKQKLGDKLFKAVKASGVKQAPKITIHLLDTEDLRSLGHLMLYPDVLKEKVATVQLKK